MLLWLQHDDECGEQRLIQTSMPPTWNSDCAKPCVCPTPYAYHDASG
jgi:hypothetical protein